MKRIDFLNEYYDLTYNNSKNVDKTSETKKKFMISSLFTHVHMSEDFKVILSHAKRKDTNTIKCHGGTEITPISRESFMAKPWHAISRTHITNNYRVTIRHHGHKLTQDIYYKDKLHCLTQAASSTFQYGSIDDSWFLNGEQLSKEEWLVQREPDKICNMWKMLVE